MHPVLPAELYDEKKLLDDGGHNFLVNPTGKFVIGGPVGDAGLTGRKIIVDTYGGMARHGGGAFSGKDPSKVDRSAAYAARYVAKNVVAAGLADKLRGAGGLRDRRGAPGLGDGGDVRHRARSRARRSPQLVEEHFDLRPGAFREYLDLHRPIYQKTAAYGHFGREDHDFTWEKTDKADALRQAAGLGERERRRSSVAAVGSHAEHLDAPLHALEAAVAGVRPVVAVADRVAHLLRGHDAAAPGEGGEPGGEVHRAAVPVARARERRRPSATPPRSSGPSSCRALHERRAPSSTTGPGSGATSIAASPIVFTSRTGGSTASATARSKPRTTAPERPRAGRPRRAA